MKGGVYVASRARIPARAAMWRDLRASGANIISSWIDKAGTGEAIDFVELWTAVQREIAEAERLVLYVEPEDLPLQGALVEIGMALAVGKPVLVVCPGFELDPRDHKPLGSWAKHPLVSIMPSIADALGAAVPAGQVSADMS